jgi:hypothetical protein
MSKRTLKPSSYTHFPSKKSLYKQINQPPFAHIFNWATIERQKHLNLELPQLIAD